MDASYHAQFKRVRRNRRPHSSPSTDRQHQHEHVMSVGDISPDKAVNHATSSQWLGNEGGASNRPYDRYELWDRDPKYYYGQERPRPRPKHHSDHQQRQHDTDYRRNPAVISSPYPNNSYETTNRHSSAWPDDSPSTSKEDGSVYETVKVFATDTTSAHGFPNIFKATTVFGRLLWTIIFLAALGVFIWQASILINRFLQFPVGVKIDIVTRSELEFPAVTLCNTNKVRRSALAESRYKEALTIDMGQTLPYYKPCIEGDFHCASNDLCLKQFLRCDGINHCRDWSDEDGCTYESCNSDGLFKCTNGSSMGICIKDSLKCNHKPDCYDGDDETGCPCKPTEFQCKKGGCVAKKKRCNSKFDCPDGSDELNCEPDDNCTGFFKCPASPQYPESCIPFEFVCDKDNDCPKGEDEQMEACNSVTTTMAPTCIDSFDCGDGNCIPNVWVCDDQVDCSTHADEEATMCNRDVIGTIRCEDGEWLCGNGWQCIFEYERCDLSAVCTDGSDELNCTCILEAFALPSSQRVDCLGMTSFDGNFLLETINTTIFQRMSCYNNNASSPNPQDVWAWNVYMCSGDVLCSNNKTTFPEPCKVLHECYIAPNAHDYRGLQWKTSSSAPCIDWSMALAVDANFSAEVYPELIGPVCRNPGGMRSGAWCFLQGATTADDWELCEIGQPSATCHPGVDLPVRLVGGGSNLEGRVEVQHMGSWGTISDSDWTIEDATVVCSQLGYSGVASTTASFAPSTGDVFMSQVNCTGYESFIVDCFYDVVLGKGLGHEMDVGVTCAGARRKRQAKNPTTPPEGCADNQYTCGSGDCVPLWQTCNNYPDCRDGSDEYLNLECGDTCTTTTKACRNSTICITPDYECDTYADCPGGTDEQFCNDPRELCPDGYWQCNRGKCIHNLRICDTITDCIEGDDEINCTQSKKGLDPFESNSWWDPYSPFVPDEVDTDKFFQEFKNSFYAHRPFSRVRSEDPADWHRFLAFSEHPDYSDLSEVLKFTKEEIAIFGHQKDDFILQCTFNGVGCRNTNNDFVQIQDDKYGNCYTFNSNASRNVRNSSRTGHQSGLSLTLFIEQDEYISLHGQEVGVRVAITKPDMNPIPASDGIDILPGTITSIGLKYNVIRRKPLPFGPCQISDATVWDIVDSKIVKVQTRSYSYQHCRRVCYLQKVQEICNCSDSVDLDGQRCKLLDVEQDLCRQLVYYLHANYPLNCSCPTQCTDHLYSSSVSQSAWPSEAFRPHLLRNIHYINPKTKNIITQDDISRNLVRLKVFYEELNYQETLEIEDYSGTSLFGDIGGTIGLYIGFSFITMLEFIELAIFLIRTRCCRWTRSRR